MPVAGLPAWGLPLPVVVAVGGQRRGDRVRAPGQRAPRNVVGQGGTRTGVVRERVVLGLSGREGHQVGFGEVAVVAEPDPATRGARWSSFP